MRRLFLFLFLMVLCLPLKAQSMVRYVTFYPVPYGSHENVKVSGKAILNARDGAHTTVMSAVKIPGIPTFEGILDLKSLSQEVFTATQIKTGNSAPSAPYGVASFDVNDSMDVDSIDGQLNDIYVASYVEPQSSITLVDSSTSPAINQPLTELASCKTSASWKALRLKGSEECHYYLICGGADNENTGCRGMDSMCGEETGAGAWYKDVCWNNYPFTCGNVLNSEGEVTDPVPAGNDYGWQFTCLCPNGSWVQPNQNHWTNNPSTVTQACSGGLFPPEERERSVPINDPGMNEESCLSTHYRDLCKNMVNNYSGNRKCAATKSCNGTWEDKTYECYGELISSEVTYSNNTCTCTFKYTWYPDANCRRGQMLSI